MVSHTVSLCALTASLSEGQRSRVCWECYGRHGFSYGSVRLRFSVEGQDLECQACWEQECLGIDPEAKKASGIKCS